MALDTVEERETKAGNYFVSNYPPYSFWRPEHVGEVHAALGRPAERGVDFAHVLRTPEGVWRIVGDEVISGFSFALFYRIEGHNGVDFIVSAQCRAVSCLHDANSHRTESALGVG